MEPTGGKSIELLKWYQLKDKIVDQVYPYKDKGKNYVRFNFTDNSFFILPYEIETTSNYLKEKFGEMWSDLDFKGD